MPESVWIIEEGAFDSCLSLETINIPDNVDTIDESVFSYCVSLRKITLPKKLRSIENEAFLGTPLTSITIPENVYSIELHAFWVTKLTEIYCLAPKPPYIRQPNGTVYGFPFDDDTYENATLYVPEQYLTTYLETDYWGKKDTFIPREENAYFRNVKGYDFSGIEDITEDLNSSPTEVYNLNGVMISNTIDNLPAGIYIIRKGNSVRKLAIK